MIRFTSRPAILPASFVDKPLMNLQEQDLDFQIIGVSEKGNSIIRFEVYKNKSTDEDDDSVSKNMVPFQIAYAVSIHKAQGLEYDSVKIIITDDIDELITHSIFYTAITRAREKLKIYWNFLMTKTCLAKLWTRFSLKETAAWIYLSATNFRFPS